VNSCTSSVGVGHRLVPHGPRRGWLVLLGLGGALLALVPAFLLHHHDVYSVRNGSGIYRAIELTAGIAIIVGANRLPLHLQFRGNRMAHVWGEVALVLGLAYAHLATLLMATLIGGLIAHLSAGRGLVKTLYNASTATVATLLAGGLVALLGYTPPLHNQAPPVVPLLVASVCFSLFNDLAISAAVAAAQRVPVWGVLRDGFFVHQIMCLASGAVGVVFVLITGAHFATLLTLPFVALGLYTAQAAGLRMVQEREAWERLDAATRELNQLNHSAVIETAVTRAAQLFRSDAVELLLDRGRGLTQVAVVGSESVCRDRADSVVSRPLSATGVQVGELRLCYRSPVLLSERESWALSTFSHAVTAALLNSQLYEELHHHAEQKTHEASHDALTGLANRAVLSSRGEDMLEATIRQDRYAALFLVDLDHFKQVNDTLGHDVGDELLRAVAQRLVGGVRRSDLVVRLGGDEFALLLPDLGSDADVTAASTSVRSALAGPVTVDGFVVPLEASMGVACAPTDGTTVRDLLRCADAAMYRAKGAPRSLRRYPTPGRSPLAERQPRGSGRPTVVSELHPALHHGELVVHFQPKVDLRTGATLGAEALARWRTPDDTLLRAADFVPVIEASCMVGGFARQVLDLALAAAATWGGTCSDASVAVNLSARDLLDRTLPGDVATALARYPVAPNRLILEITETVMMRQLDVVDDVLADLRGIGVQLSVDDFGTGFSSLTFLSHVDVDEVKIDQSFVSRMLTNPVDATLVDTLLGLGRRLGLRVVAEGVENSRQRDHLLAMGCESAQGYFLGPPMPSIELERTLLLPGSQPPRPRRAHAQPQAIRLP
jgi:diguanylate cyclase (GGDEF)-like protein